MWRKQEEPKSSSPSTDVPATAQVEAPTARSYSPAPASAPVRATPASHLTSALAIKGEITGSDDLIIDGQLQGSICLDAGRVTIGKSGDVSATIEAREIVVNGKVEGVLHGRERVQIGPTGYVVGDVLTRRIYVEDGAEIHGKVDLSRTEEPVELQPAVVHGAAPESAGPVAVRMKEPSAAA